MAERSLVPVKTIEAVKLSPGQEKEILDLARMYLRRFGLSITKSVLRQTIGVLGDALKQGMESSGRETFKASDKLKPLIGLGLKMREDLKNRTQKVLDLTVKSETTDPEFLGPLGLPAGLVSLARREMRSCSPLVPALLVSRELAELGEQRLLVLDRLAEVALAHLPEGVPQVGLEAFPEISDRAKMVRNMIASFVHRGDLSPLITTFDLKEFAKMNHNFTQEKVKGLTGLLDIKSPGERPYLEALFSQTEHAFLDVSDIPADDDPVKTDYFYRQFTKDLLLLHPALEEPQIVIFPEGIQPGAPHLWENAADFDGVEIPKQGLLIQALRQARARNDAFNEGRLSAALKHWKWLEGENLVQEKKVRQMEGEILKDRGLLQKIANPDYQLPAEALFIRTERQHVVSSRASFLKRELKRFGQMIHEILDVQVREAKRYGEQLAKKYGKNLPDEVSISRAVYIRRLESEARTLHSRRQHLKMTLQTMEQFFHGDLLWLGSEISEHGIFVREGAEEIVEDETEEAENLLSKVRESQQPFSFTEDKLERAVDTLNETLSWFRDSYLFRSLSQGALEEYYNFWDKALSDLKRIKNPVGKALLAEKLVPGILQNRVGLLATVFSVLEEEKQTSKMLEKLQLEAGYLKRSPREPFVEGVLWPKGEALDYLAEMKASDLLAQAVLKSADREKLGKEAEEMRHRLYNYPLKALPKVISSYKQLEEWLLKQAEGLRWAIKEEEENILRYKISEDKAEKRKAGSWETRIKQYRSQLQSAAFLMSRLNNPLLPPLGERKWPRETFVEIWRRRVGLVYALHRREEITRESKEAEEFYWKVMREEYKSMVSARLRSKRETLAAIKARNIKGELIDRMRVLDLTKP